MCSESNGENAANRPLLNQGLLYDFQKAQNVVIEPTRRDESQQHSFFLTLQLPYHITNSVDQHLT